MAVAPQVGQYMVFSVPCKGIHRGMTPAEGVTTGGDDSGVDLGFVDFLGDERRWDGTGGTPKLKPAFSSRQSMFCV